MRFIQAILLILSLNLYSQFPSPKNFDYRLTYIELDQWGVCDGETVYGPSYCSSFSWQLPDTSLTEAQLESFELFDIVSNDTIFIHSLTDTVYITTTPYEGDLFVIAVYSNPSGRSEPSNIVNNPGIPIGIDETDFESDISLIQYPEKDFLLINTNTEIKLVRIINLNGQPVYEERNENFQIYIGNLKSGIYIIELMDLNNHFLRKKFTKI